jgi:hypothetical protein
VFDSIGTNITNGQTFVYRALDNYASIVATSGTVRLDNSLVTLKRPAACRVDSGGTLVMNYASVRSDPGVNYSFDVRGVLNWEGSTLVEPQNGLLLEKPNAQVYSGGVLLSKGDGIRFSGNQSKTEMNFFLVDGSAGNGLVFDGAFNCILQNVRIENSGAMDVLLRNTSLVLLLDCSYSDAKVSVDQTSRLVRSWTTNFLFTNSSGKSLPGVILEVTDATGVLVGRDTTDASGFTDAFILDQYRQTGTNRTPLTPHQLKVKFGERDTVIQYTANTQTVREIVLSSTFTTGVEEQTAAVPATFELMQNYPNPFNPSTTIRFSLPQREFVTLKVFDVLGREVATVVNEWKEAGSYKVTFDIRHSAFDISSSGVYFYRLEAGGFVETKNFVLLK